MNAFAKVATPSVMLGKCTGTINATEIFDARLVELSDAIYPPPHGEAHVMLATQRAPAPDYTTKELKISFSKGFEDGSYGLYPDDSTVRVLFIDRSTPAKPVVYTQYQGIARVQYDSLSGTFSGEISAVLENLDEDDRKAVNLKVEFEAFQHVPARRISRRPSPRAGYC
ncbi:hypothetical protein PSH97_14525 [Pseudomonas cucumis]|uniref:Uncharacterized protein n=1 Tax=Pseudomonas cucumis TaxID=2954082 RepID=A0ABY9ESY6_9PSED|nr:hypothetical protein [Pseudomonas cucumis]WLG82363.1 hypothetical protein PSH97_14525 [Pseudomonas cucumis]